LYTNSHVKNAKEDKQRIDAELGNFDHEALHAALDPVQAVLQSCRKALFSAMDSFHLAANPISKLLISLKQTRDVKLDDRAKPLKVLWQYAQLGVPIDARWPEHEQFSRIMAHVCKGEKTDAIANVAKAVTVRDFIEAIEVQDAAKMNQDDGGGDEAIETLKEKLYAGLMDQNDELADLNQAVKDLEDEKSTLKQTIKELEGTAAKGDKETKEEKAERLKESKEDKAERLKEVKDSKKEMRDLSKNISTAQSKFSKAVRHTFKAEMRILMMVLRDVASVYHSITLAHGMADAEKHLTEIYQVIRGHLTSFREQVGGVSIAYSQRLERLALKDPRSRGSSVSLVAA